MLQAVLSESGILKQLLLDLGGLLGPMLGDEYVVMEVFLPFLLSLVEEPAMASEGALFLAVNLMRSHIASSEVGSYSSCTCITQAMRTGTCASIQRHSPTNASNSFSAQLQASAGHA